MTFFENRNSYIYLIVIKVNFDSFFYFPYFKSQIKRVNINYLFLVCFYVLPLSQLPSNHSFCLRNILKQRTFLKMQTVIKSYSELMPYMLYLFSLTMKKIKIGRKRPKMHKHFPYFINNFNTIILHIWFQRNVLHSAQLQ